MVYNNNIKRRTKVIYLHRFQVSDYKNSNLTDNSDFDGFEIDFRYLEHGKNIIVSHDYSSYPVLDTFKNVLSTNKTIIANSKESGIEEKLFKEGFKGFRNNVYFLDSQIPDILKYCKSDERYKGHFIIRVSDFEPLSVSLIRKIEARKFWIDTKMCNSKCSILNHILMIKDCCNTLNVDPEIILTAPDVFGFDLDTEKQMKEFKSFIKDLDVSICTKSPKFFREVRAD